MQNSHLNVLFVSQMSGTAASRAICCNSLRCGLPDAGGLQIAAAAAYKYEITDMKIASSYINKSKRVALALLRVQ
jgi:hypothetical protein